MAAENEGEEVRARYAREAARYDRRWDAYVRRTVDETLDAAAPGAGERWVDVGCGTGVLLERARALGWGAAGVGVDLSIEMLSVARARLGAASPLLAADVHRLPLRSESFGLAVSTSVLHHWDDPERALAEIFRVLLPGGRLVLTDWSADHLPLRLYSRVLKLTDRSLVRVRRTAELTGLARSAGFAVDAVKHFRVNWLWAMTTLTAHRPD
jgi:ubiquinone/menaquinone biosynthesis C-methylase UbiE